MYPAFEILTPWLCQEFQSCGKVQEGDSFTAAVSHRPEDATKRQPRSYASCLVELRLDLAFVPIRSCGWQTKEWNKISLQSWSAGPDWKSGLEESGGGRGPKPQLTPLANRSASEDHRRKWYMYVPMHANTQHTHTHTPEKEVKVLTARALENNLSL